VDLASSNVIKMYCFWLDMSGPDRSNSGRLTPPDYRASLHCSKATGSYSGGDKFKYRQDHRLEFLAIFMDLNSHPLAQLLKIPNMCHDFLLRYPTRLMSVFLYLSRH